MASKYINLEAAATQLSITTTELNRLREEGQIRAFADRGTWKFKSEDIDELGRTLTPDSGHDIAFVEQDDDDEIALDDGVDIAGGSSVVLGEEMGDQPTVISKKAPNLPPSSDSDVRLVVDPSLESDDRELPVEVSQTSSPQPPKTDQEADSDSDVRLFEPDSAAASPTPTGDEDDPASDIIGGDDWGGISDSDVRLAPLDDDSGPELAASDDDQTVRDMNLAGPEDSESDVSLIDAEDLQLAPPSGIDQGGAMIDDPGSDITLMLPDDGSEANILSADDESDEDSILSDMMSGSGPESGLTLSSGDSGISLDLAIDSGLSLGGEDDDDDDSITLAADSGISLVPDSGIGLSLSDDDDDSATMPMLGTIGDDEDDTSFDMPLLDDSGSEIESDSGDTGVVMFDDDEDDSSADTMEFDSSELAEDSFADFDDEDSFDELSDGELDVSGEILDDDDVLDAGDDDFEDDFESGESVSALPVPGGMRGGAGVAAAPEWDMLSFSLVLVSTILMGVCTLLMYDLVRSMWAHEAPIGVNGMILDALQGIIKG